MNRLHLMHPRQTLAVTVAATLWLAGCDVEFPQQEVRLRHNDSTNTLDVLFLCQGLTTKENTEKDLDKGVRAVERLLQGHREFMLMNWPLHVNLDGNIDAARATAKELREKGDLEPKDRYEVRWQAKSQHGVVGVTARCTPRCVKEYGIAVFAGDSLAARAFPRPSAPVSYGFCQNRA